jgi:hypothetical protein
MLRSQPAAAVVVAHTNRVAPRRGGTERERQRHNLAGLKDGPMIQQRQLELYVGGGGSAGARVTLVGRQPVIANDRPNAKALIRSMDK